MTGFDENDANEAKSVDLQELAGLVMQMDLKENPILKKTFNKVNGRYLGFQIAIGRKMIKLLKEKYASDDTTRISQANRMPLF